MGFHRRTTPTYSGGLPAGYDYINNPALNGDPGAPAPADGKKGSGPNDGTYFVAFGEDATSSNTNRGLDALAENCDLLDDSLRGSQVVMRWQDGSTVPALASFAMTAEVWVGSPSDAPVTANDQATRDRIIKVVDDSGNELEVAGVRVKASLIHNGASVNVVGQPADGFYTNPTVDFSPSIPAGTSFRLYYMARRSLFDILANKPSELLLDQVRTAERVTAEVKTLFRLLHKDTGELWDDPWDTTIWDAAMSGLNDRYRSSTDANTDAPAETNIFVTNTLNQPGSGGYIKRDGPGVTLYAQNNPTTDSGPFSALLRLVDRDTTAFTTSSGLVVQGGRSKAGPGTYAGETDIQPMFMGLAHLWPHRGQGTLGTTDPFTRVLVGASVTLTTPNNDPDSGESVVTLPVGQWWWETIFGGQTTVNFGYDLIELQWDQGGNTYVETFVLTQGGSSATPTNERQARIRRINGKVHDFTGATNAVVRQWFSTKFAVGDGTGIKHDAVHGSSPDIPLLNGPVFFTHGQTAVGGGVDGISETVPDECPAFYAASGAPAGTGGFAMALKWGAAQQGGSPPTPPVKTGSLNYNGSIDCLDVRASNSLVAQNAGGVAGDVRGKQGAFDFGAPAGRRLADIVLSSGSPAAVNLDLSLYRQFNIRFDGTILFESFNITVTAGSPREGERILISFYQDANTGGLASLTGWSSEFIFSGGADSQIAFGENAITVYEGIYLTCKFGSPKWFMRKLAVYNQP